MSFWDFFNQWQGGAAAVATLTAIPILSLFVLSAQGKLNITGWESKTFHGLYSRVRLFIKSNGERSNNGKADLIAQVPLSELGNYSKYKWCMLESSKLKKSSSTPKQVSEEANSGEKCELQYFSDKSNLEKNKADDKVISYLLESITKYLEVQHAANMLLLYDKDVSLKNNNSNHLIPTISQACKISDLKAFQVIKKLFLSSDNHSKNCLMSPITMNLNLKLNGSVGLRKAEEGYENLTKEKLQSGELSGVINYGIFDYFSYNKLKEISSPPGNGKNKNYSLKINWEIPYVLKKDLNGNKCSLEKLHEKTKVRQLKIEDIKECISSTY